VTLRSAAVGIGWRQPHYAELLERRPALDFLEVHAENFFADGGASLAVLDAAREHYAISLHGVGLGLGSTAGLDPWHLDRLARLCERVQPALVSEHACFSRVHGGHAADLLPLPRTAAALARLADQVDQLQQHLRRQVLVENISAYVAWDQDELSEPAFFAELVRRTGCGLLLDVNNLVVNARNAQGCSPDEAAAVAMAWVDHLPAGLVGEIHLAGYTEQPGLLIDDHATRVRHEVWRVYEHALARFGPVPSLLEWDTDLPALDVLLDEAEQARRTLVDLEDCV
jgi:uncharacterized protein (UPF0276 family)